MVESRHCRRRVWRHPEESSKLGWNDCKSLSLVLVGSLSVRVGDVGRSRGYTGKEYMQNRHLDLTIEGDEPILANVRAAVTIEFAKALKDKAGHETVRYLVPLVEEHNRHMCPISLLLVHSLRHSLVDGTSVRDVLELALKRSDRTIIWLFPESPMLSAFGIAPARCLLE